MDEAEAESSFADLAAEALLSDDSKSASSSTARILAVLIEQNYSSQNALLALARQLLRRSGELGAAVARFTSDTGRVDDMLPRQEQGVHRASSRKSKQRKNADDRPSCRANLVAPPGFSKDQCGRCG